MTDEEIKQVFFYVDDKDPEGLYADDVNILDFGRKIAAFEHKRCMKIASSVNTKVAELLEKNPPA